MAIKNLKIDTTEYKMNGTLNLESMEDGIMLLETEDGELALHNYLQQFDSDLVEITIKRKIEQNLV